MKKSILLSLCVSSILFAGKPTINDATREIQLPNKIKKSVQKELVPLTHLKKEYRPQFKDDKTGRKIMIDDFSFLGNEHISTIELHQLVKKYEHKALTFSEMQNIALIITQKYREYGYFVARAYIPIQKMKNQTLEIEIIEGAYGEFKLINNSKVNSKLIQETLNHNNKDQVINSTSLERSLLIVNDLDGVVISSANIKPGEKIGTSDFIVTTENTKKYGGYILVDDYGSRYTGANRLMVGANLYSPFNYGDKLSFTGLVSNQGGLEHGDIAYTLPLYKNGLKGKINFSKTSYALSDRFKSLDASGTSDTVGLTFTYPIIKKRMQNLNVSLNLTNNALKDEIKSAKFLNKKVSNVMRLGLAYKKLDAQFFGLHHNIDVSSTLSYGDLKFKNEIQKKIDANGANTQGNFSKIRLDISSNTQINNKVSLATSIKLQQSLGNKNLDGSEDISIGGAYGVKLYPDGELSAENGFVINLKASYNLPLFYRVNSNITTFYDRGKASMQNPLATFQSRTLQDVGVGYEADYKNFFLITQVAWKIDNEAIVSATDKNSIVLAMMGYSF